MARFAWLHADRHRPGRLFRSLVAVWWLGIWTSVWPQVDPRANPEPASRWQEKPAQTFHAQVIVTAHPLASDAGVRMLRQGGNAVDAAIAAQLVLTLVEPQSSGLGGGAFLLLSNGREVVALDGRETAPQAADERLFLRPDGSPLPWAEAVPGGLSVGTPGVMRLLELAHRQHGKLRWSQLFEPAIRLAQQGFAVSPRLHQAIIEQASSLLQDPAAAAYFFDRSGQAWPVGHRLRNLPLARTLRHLARAGADGFYQGSLAREMVQRVREHPRNPGRLREEDLARYTAVERPALCQPHTFSGRTVRICGMPPPSSGGLAVAQILGLLERSELFQSSVSGWAEPDVTWTHLFTEASRLAYADRAAYVADPAFVAAPGGDWRTLLAPSYLTERARALPASPTAPSMRTAPAGQPAGHTLAWAPMPDQPERGTSHLSVVDGRGQAVSLTSSIESSMGARIMVGGFLLNNQLTDFSFLPRDAQGRQIANRVEAGKRPRSSMSPTLVLDAEDDRVLAVLGSPGGSLIIPYVAQTLLALLHDRLSPQQAVSLPHVASLNGPTLIESDRFTPAWQQQLQTLGAPIHTTPMVSGLHLLVNQGSARSPRWATGIDPRREGAAAGD
jgi:gamma-glutamyltranspeptidase/glutathione hydrolase